MTFVKAAALAKNQVPLTNEERGLWNNYVEYLKQKGMAGNPALDNKDTGLSQQLFNDYKAQNPHFSLTYDQVPAVQADMQNSRAQAIAAYRKNPQTFPDVKSEDEIMPQISPIDGWLGSKTSLHKYPVAKIVVNGVPQDFGTNREAYNAAVANYQK